MLLWLICIILRGFPDAPLRFRSFLKRLAHSQFEDGQCCHAVPVILSLELILDVLVEEGQVVRVVSVDALNERVDVLWPCGRVVSRHGMKMMVDVDGTGEKKDCLPGL